jgi:hypothetical protein
LLFACGANKTIPDPDVYDSDSGAGAPRCLPNLDGKIEATELSVRLGVPFSLIVSPPNVTRPVDVAGQLVDGERVWDWSVDYSDDLRLEISASAVEDKWYAADFPGGQYVLPFDAAGTTEAVYASTPDGVVLLGFASTDANPPAGKTLIVYNEPVDVYRFPLEVGQSWTSIGEARNSTVAGLPYAADDTYETEIREVGELDLPDVGFDTVLQLHRTVTNDPAVGNAIVTRQVSFLFECYGEVARAVSPPGTVDENFTMAAEVRRLGL